MANQVEIQLSADVKSATAAINKFASDTQKQLDSLNLKTFISAINDGFDLASKVVENTFGRIEGFVGKAVEAAVEGENAITRLTQALKLNGGFSKEAVKNFEDFAQALQNVTGVQDDVILQNLALAKTFGATNSEAKQIIKTAIDLSAATGEDLATSVFKLNNTFNGLVDRSLAKAFPALKNLKDVQLQAGAAIDIVEKKVRGTAAALQNTFSGAVNQATIQQNEFLKAIGNAIIQNPAVIAAIQGIADGFKRLTDFINANRDSIDFFVTQSVKFLEDAFSSILDILRAVTPALIAFFAILTAQSAYSLAVKGLQAVAGAMLGLSEAISFATVAATALKATLFFGLTILIDAAITKFSRLKDEFGGFSGAFQALKIQFETGFQRVIIAVEEFSLTLLDKLQNIPFIGAKIEGTGFSENLKKDIDDRTKQIENFNKEIEKLRKNATKPVKAAVQITEDRIEHRTVEIDIAKLQKDIEATIKNPFHNFFETLDIQPLSANIQKGLAEGLGLVSKVLDGAKGAVSLISSAVGALVNYYVPGLGSVVSDIIEKLAQGPEFIKKMINEFIDALPAIFKNISIAAAEAIITLLDRIPDLVQGFADAFPVVLDKLIELLPKFLAKTVALIPKLAVLFVTSLIKEIPYIVKTFSIEFMKIPGLFAVELVNEIKGAFGNVGSNLSDAGSSIGSGIGNFFSGVGDFFGFAEGGRIPNLPLLANDKGLTKVSAGEQIFSKDLSDRLERFLNTGGSQPQVINIRVGERELANVIYDINRRGFRT